MLDRPSNKSTFSHIHPIRNPIHICLGLEVWVSIIKLTHLAKKLWEYLEYPLNSPPL